MRGEYALVDLKLGVSSTIAAALGASAAIPTEGPGLTQADAVQLVAGWALMRDAIMSGAARKMRMALYDAEGRFLGVLNAEDMDRKVPDNVKSVRPIAGNGPMIAPEPGGPGLPKDWGMQLARALDRVTYRIGKSKVGSQPPPGYVQVSDTVPVVGPAVVGIIIGGAALAIIGTTAVYRYFDPDVRKHAATLDSAARSYESRLAVKKETGKMPDPSPLETQAAETVKALSKDETKRSLLVAGGIAGGIAAATVGVAALRRHYA